MIAYNYNSYSLYMKDESNQVIDGYKFKDKKKGIVLENCHNIIIRNCKVFNIGEEGIHVRQNSDQITIEKCEIYKCGLLNPEYGEGIYIGSDYKKWEKFGECEGNFPDRTRDVLIKNCYIHKTKAECVDIKEGSLAVNVEMCIFDGSEITGLNGANSIIQANGSLCTFKYNAYLKRSTFVKANVQSTIRKIEYKGHFYECGASNKSDDGDVWIKKEK